MKGDHFEAKETFKFFNRADEFKDWTQWERQKNLKKINAAEKFMDLLTRNIFWSVKSGNVKEMYELLRIYSFKQISTNETIQNITIRMQLQNIVTIYITKHHKTEFNDKQILQDWHVRYT